MQLEVVSPEHGGSSLQLSTSREEYAATPNQAAIPMSRLEAINLANRIPPTSIHKDKVTDTQSTKRKKWEVDEHTFNSDINK
jgi:hypothetical protein